MIRATIRVQSNTAGPAVERLLQGVRRTKKATTKMGRRVQKLILDYGLNEAPKHSAIRSELGANSSGFLASGYEMASQFDALKVTDTTVELNLPRAQFARAFDDVTILPGGGKRYLTFAATAEAYGRRARSFDNLEFGFAFNRKFGRFCPALVEKAGQTILKFGRKNKQGERTAKAVAVTTGLTAVYWLVRKATQKKDRSLLPSGEAMQTAAKAGLIEWAEQELLKKEAGNG